ncbi:uncharacterized protein LOC112510252 [Cynara cardunculus var. scolymus]|uniref:uncharacterized protein LOC112510252 n=1 Tax=Cynara cardunculus var. scolymus TaxID=59895 RepID=UPI000D62F5FA|nr:uncharacterized protein LOC112510252 [Cynara cardunculus var. scolymus]
MVNHSPARLQSAVLLGCSLLLVFSPSNLFSNQGSGQELQIEPEVSVQASSTHGRGRGEARGRGQLQNPEYITKEDLAIELGTQLIPLLQMTQKQKKRQLGEKVIEKRKWDGPPHDFKMPKLGRFDNRPNHKGY